MKKILGVIGYSVLAIAIPAIVVTLTCWAQSNGYQIKCSDSVLTFIGILATFVVISNQVQIRSIESRIDRIEDKVNRNNEGIIDAKLNSSDNVEYMRLSVGLILQDKGEQLSIIIAALKPKYENLEKRLDDFSKGKNEDRYFIFDLAEALKLGKDNRPKDEN